MKTTLKVIGVLVLILVFVVGAAILALPHLLSTDLVKTKVAELVEKQTGRQLTIVGDTSFKLFPNIAISLDDISLSNPAGMSGPPLVKVSSLRANLKLMPLFQGQTTVDSITLIKPEFNLLVDKQGQKNWDFQSAQNADEKDGPGRGSSDASNKFTLGMINIKDGLVRYTSINDKIDEQIEAINLALLQKTSDRSITTNGNLRWKNEILNITSMISNPDELMAHKPSNVLIQLKSHLTDTEYVGMLILGDQAGIDGFLISDTPSVRKLAAFLGHELAQNEGFGKLKLKTKIKANTREVQFATGQFLFDNMDLVANGSVKLQKPRPFITATIEADRIDLNPYLGAQGTSSASQSASSQNPDHDTPIDLSGLKAVDGHFTLKTKEILYKKARLGEGAFQVTMKNGQAEATIEQLSLYRGSATGTIVLDGSGATSNMGGTLSLKDVLTGAILRDFADFDKLAGKGTLQGNFNARGNSAKALKNSLAGSVKMTLLNGRLEGFDLAKYVGDMTGNTIPGGNTSSNGKPMTAYDQMSGLITINKGIASNKDFLLTGKFFRVRAAGTVDLVKETLRLRVAPKLFSGNWNFAPPLRVTGSLSNPRVTLDALAFLGGGDGVVRSLRGLLSGKKVDLGEVLTKRGLQTDREIETYLAGKKVDTSGDQPANDNTTGNGGDTGESGSQLNDLLGGNSKETGKLLKKLFQ